MDDITPQLLATLRLIRTERVGPVTFRGLVQRYGSAQDALQHLPTLGKRSPKIPTEADAVREIESWEDSGTWPLLLGETPYPAALAAIEDAPPILLCKGQQVPFSERRIAMVGARNASLSGQKFAKALAGDLGHAGFVVTSGLARGIDTAAHEGSLQTGTIAVLAGGVDVIYPRQNAKLYDQVVVHGTVVSDMPLGTEPVANLFPRRNRIISGLSEAVIVVEATERSGSLITARLAGDQGRDVMAVPGSPMDPRAAGPNRLIRDGAVLIRSADDVLESLGNLSSQGHFDPSDTDQPSQAIEKEQEIGAEDLNGLIIELLGTTPTSVDELVRQCQVSAASVAAAVLELELSGHVERHPGGRLARTDGETGS